MPNRPARADFHKMLPVTVIGSYPPPGWFARCLADRRAGRLDGGVYDEAAADALLAVLHDQEAAGVDLVSDGELGRIVHAPDPALALQETLGFLWGLLSRLEGVAYEGDEAPQGRFRVTGPLAAPRGLGIAREYAAAREVAARPLKTTLPGPFSLALSLVAPERAEALHGVLEQLGPILRRELEALAELGAAEVQLDEPSLGMFMGINPERWVTYFNELVAGLPFRLHLHICFRSLIHGHRDVPRTYKPLVPYLNDLEVDVIHLEYSLNDMRELALLDDIDYDKVLAIGVVDAHDPAVESPRQVARRIRATLNHVSVRRLQVAPDCGLSALSRPVARAKLEALCAGAALVREEFSRGRR